MAEEEREISAGMDWLPLLKENWAWAAPLIYIYVTIVGMVQAWFQFRAFGINVFEFSELNDFLLAAFREPLSFLAILGIIAYGGIGMGVTKIVERIRKAKSGQSLSWIHKFQRWMMNVTFILLVLIAPYFGPLTLHKGYGDEWKEDFLSNPDRKVKATFKDMDKYESNAGWVDNLVLIGTTDKYVFFFDESKREILTAPLSNVLLIRRAESSNKAYD